MVQLDEQRLMHHEGIAHDETTPSFEDGAMSYKDLGDYFAERAERDLPPIASEVTVSSIEDLPPQVRDAIEEHRAHSDPLEQ